MYDFARVLCLERYPLNSSFVDNCRSCNLIERNVSRSVVENAPTFLNVVGLWLNVGLFEIVGVSKVLFDVILSLLVLYFVAV